MALFSGKLKVLRTVPNEQSHGGLSVQRNMLQRKNDFPDGFESSRPPRHPENFSAKNLLPLSYAARVSPPVEGQPAWLKAFPRLSLHRLGRRGEIHAENNGRRTHAMAQQTGHRSCLEVRVPEGLPRRISGQPGLGLTDACDPPPAAARGPRSAAVSE